tara:strand:+ start:366 stop:617 length:252 start_codon:yes stop_codon:yes gene_type:complete
VKITKSKLKKLVKEAYESYKELTPARPVNPVQYKEVGETLDDLLTELFNIRTRAKKLEQYNVAGHIDEAINALEIAISSGSEY